MSTMGPLWTVALLLSFTAFQQMQAIKVNVYSLLPQSSYSVFVPCLIKSDGDLDFQLTKDGEMVYPNMSRTPQTQMDIRLHQNKSSPGFSVTGKLTQKQTVYRCEGVLTFPPPLQNFQCDQIILILEKEKPECDSCPTESRGSLHVWITAVTVLGSYSMAVSVAALIIWFKLKEGDTQNDYINAKPSVPQNRRRKRGVQHPVPRYF